MRQLRWSSWLCDVSKPHPNFALVIEIAERQSESEIESVALNTDTIYRDSLVPPLENINLGADFLESESISIEIPTEVEPVAGDRVMYRALGRKGVLQKQVGDMATVLFDGDNKPTTMAAYLLFGLRSISVLRGDLMKAIDCLRKFLKNPESLAAIKQIPQIVFSAAFEYLKARSGQGIIHRLGQVLQNLDYQFYLQIWA